MSTTLRQPPPPEKYYKIISLLLNSSTKVKGCKLNRMIGSARYEQLTLKLGRNYKNKRSYLDHHSVSGIKQLIRT